MKEEQENEENEKSFDGNLGSGNDGKPAGRNPDSFSG